MIVGTETVGVVSVGTDTVGVCTEIVGVVTTGVEIDSTDEVGTEMVGKLRAGVAWGRIPSRASSARASRIPATATRAAPRVKPRLYA